MPVRTSLVLLEDTGIESWTTDFTPWALLQTTGVLQSQTLEYTPLVIGQQQRGKPSRWEWVAVYQGERWWVIH